MKKMLKLAITALTMFTFINVAHAGGDPAKGESLFKKCSICHAVGDGAAKKVGPPLNNIIGAKAGAQEGFNYSKAMKAAGLQGLVWTEDKLSAFLEKPKRFIPGTKMAFPNLPNPEDRSNIIAFLKKFSK